MNIGIDIDGVLTNFERELLDYATKMCVEEKWPIDIKRLDQYDEEKTFNWNQEQAMKFWNKYLIKYFSETPVRTFAPEVIEKLRNDGHKIYIITARNNYGMPKGHEGEEQEITRKWLEDNNIKYEKLIFANDEEKLNRCKENEVDIMIEDSPDNIKRISKEIKMIKFDCQYNRKVNNKNVITAYSWYHIYDIITNLQNEKKK